MPTKSTFPDIEIPQTDLWTFLFERETEFPDSKTIYIDSVSHRSYSYADVKSATIGFGRGLKQALNWTRNEVLLVYCLNSIDIPIVIWGTHWAGGIVSPANASYTISELVFQLKDSGAKAIVTHQSLLSNAHAAAKIAGIEEDRIILIEDGQHEKFKHFTEICNSRSTRGSESPRTIVKNPGQDLAFIVYSSGTTGYPKGVMLSHRNIISNILMLKAGEGVNLAWQGGRGNKGDSLLGFLPFYHIYGLTSLVHQALFNGLELIVMSKYNLKDFCSYIQEYRITLAYVVPPVLLQLAKSDVVADYDLSSLRMMSSGAAPLTRELVDAVYQRLKVPIKQGYGLSETSPTTHSQPWETWYVHVGSVGLLLANQTVKYMSPEEIELPVGETGELWIKGPNVFQGYLNNVESTRHALTKDGYFKTGDVGYQDAEGNLFITDRAKELIKYKGFQVAPAELEGLLLACPEVQDAAVIGVDKPEQGTEVPMAFIVLARGVKGTEETAKEIHEWVNQRVSYYKRLRGGIRWVDSVPRSPSGKILRKSLRAKYHEKDRSSKL